ncbi:MAG: TonB-dependent receptor [Halieaceae bacterium]|nr:TonB-dependent receptor [Halieaceae bacterium]
MNNRTDNIAATSRLFARVLHAAPMAVSLALLACTTVICSAVLSNAATAAVDADAELANAPEHAHSGFIETVTVIGTAIKGTPIDSPYAVTSMDRDRLEARGAPTWSDFFKGLGASRGVLGERSSAFNSNQFNTVASSVGNVNLRGLGASRTLVLFNGRRQVYLPARLIGGRYVDINVMPLIAVERVEVLKEGASAIYGSDALSGVVNFATRKDFEGLDLSVDHEAIEDAGNSRLGAIWGRDFGGAHLVASFEQERHSRLGEGDRPYTLATWRPGQRGGWSSFGNPGAYLVRDAERRVTEVVVDPSCDAFGGYAEPNTCRYRYQSFFNLIEETRFNRLFSELNGHWGEAGKYHLEALWSNARSPEVRASPSYPFVTLLSTDVLEVAPNHPGRVELCDLYGSDIDRCADDAAWYFRGRTIGNSGPATEVERKSETLRLAGSLSGLVTFLNRTHDYDLGVSWSQSTGTMTDSGTYTERLFLAFRGYGGPDCGVGVIADAASPAKMRLNPDDLTGRAPGQGDCRYFNPFSNALQHSAQYGAQFENEANPFYRPALANSGEIMSWLGNILENKSRSELLVFDATLSGDLIPESLSYAVGYQLRRFDASARPADESNFEVHPCQVRFDQGCAERDRFGPYAFTTTYRPYDVDQTVHRVFSEVAFAWGEKLHVQLAGNYEDYSVASSFDPRIAVRWQINDALALRGSAQTTYRAPSADELNQDKLTTLEFVEQTGTYIPVDRTGGDYLEPEAAFTYNLGAILILDHALEATLDYWQYRFDDVIDAAPHGSMVNLYAGEATRNLAASRIVCPAGRADRILAAGGTPCSASDVARVEIPLLNWPGIRTSGIDLHLSSHIPMGQGELVPELEVSYLIDYRVDALVENGLQLEPERDASGRLNFGHYLAPSLPKLKARLSAAWLRGNVVLSSHLGYISSYKDEIPNTTAPRIDSFLTWDMTLQWHLPASGLNLAFSALNITAAKAPTANLEQGFDGSTHTAKGRRFKLALTWSFDA